MKKQNFFLIACQSPDGVHCGYKHVTADTAEEAIEILKNAGVDKTTGYNYSDYTIQGVAEWYELPVLV